MGSFEQHCWRYGDLGYFTTHATVFCQQELKGSFSVVHIVLSGRLFSSNLQLGSIVAKAEGKCITHIFTLQSPFPLVPSAEEVIERRWSRVDCLTCSNMQHLYTRLRMAHVEGPLVRTDLRLIASADAQTFTVGCFSIKPQDADGKSSSAQPHLTAPLHSSPPLLCVPWFFARYFPKVQLVQNWNSVFLLLEVFVTIHNPPTIIVGARIPSVATPVEHDCAQKRNYER